jgi:phage host-nuclease inhibitor protein Gam
MARPKKAGKALASVEDCSSAMSDLVIAQTQLEALVADRNREVATVQARYETSIDRAREAVGALEASLEDYYYAHIPEIEAGGKKHLDTANGRMGRRVNPPKLSPLNRSWTWKRIIDLVQVVYKERFLLKPKPEIDRDKLRCELAAEELKQLGLKVDQGETFYIEPARLPGVEV